MDNSIVILCCKDASLLEFIMEVLSQDLLATESLAVEEQGPEMYILRAYWTFVPISEARWHKWRAYARGFRAGVRWGALQAHENSRS